MGTLAADRFDAPWHRNGGRYGRRASEPGVPTPTPTIDPSRNTNYMSTIDTISDRLKRGGTATTTLGMVPNTGLGLASTDEVDRWIRANYGYMAAFLDIPEMGSVLRKAAREGWDENRLYGAVTQTNWWRNTSAAQRTWTQLMSEDPAEARRLAGQTAATIQNRARSLGINLSSGQISSLATTATAAGWTDAQIVDKMLAQINWANLEAGDLTAMRDNVRALASDYIIGISEETARSYAQRIASGEMSMEGVRSAFLRQAKARFGWMESQLDQGITVRDYFRSTSDAIADELELDPDAIDITDPKWLGVMEVRDKDGNLGPASINEARMAARKDPRWARTRGAQETTTNMLGMIADTFGLRGI